MLALSNSRTVVGCAADFFGTRTPWVYCPSSSAPCARRKCPWGTAQGGTCRWFGVETGLILYSTPCLQKTVQRRSASAVNSRTVVGVTAYLLGTRSSLVYCTSFSAPCARRKCPWGTAQDGTCAAFLCRLVGLSILFGLSDFYL